MLLVAAGTAHNSSEVKKSTSARLSTDFWSIPKVTRAAVPTRSPENFTIQLGGVRPATQSSRGAKGNPDALRRSRAHATGRNNTNVTQIDWRTLFVWERRRRVQSW